jgi:methionyl-tRNA synthetase
LFLDLKDHAMSNGEPYYITTAISYPNGEPHIGHAYELVATDMLARFHRLDGRDVFFLTGTDEHGIKMEQTAQSQGKSARELADELSPRFHAMAERLNASNDDFIRTTEPRHYRASQAIWSAMAANGDIYLDKYAGWYSVRDEAYYGEDELIAGENGQKLSPQGTPVEWVEEPSYFFRLSAYAERLLDHYEANPGFIMPESRRNEVVSFVKGGLRDLSISRTTFSWGVPVPDDPDHVMYVWVDALTNYLTGTGYPDLDSASYQRLWPANLHVIGKDIVRFHAIYWPAFLMSAGLPLPERVFGHGFLNVKGEKMSKTVGNVVDPFELAEVFGVDQFRYFFLREVPFGQDGSYSPEGMITRINADLANDFGNLVQRVLSMIAKNCGGAVPAPSALSEEDKVLLAAAGRIVEEMRTNIAEQAIHKALEALWSVIGDANRYVDAQAPWALRKSDPERMATVLYVLAETIRHLALLAQPVVPEAAGKILDQLAVPADARAFDRLGSAGALEPGTALPKPKGVFPRYVEAEGQEAAS